MKRNDGLPAVLRETVRQARGLTAGMAASIAGAIVLALAPPLVLESIVDGLTAGGGVRPGLALVYFAVLAAAALFEAAQNVTITVFGQRVTHGLRRRMCGKLSRLPASYFSQNPPGAVTSRFVGDVDAVDSLFTNGVISMFADGCRVAGILVMIFLKNTGLGLLMLLVTPLLFAVTRLFRRRMLRAQLLNRAALARVTNHVPETIRNLRMIRSLFRQRYMERRYDEYLGESYRAVEKTNLYDSVYSPIVIFTRAAVIAAVMLLSAAGAGTDGLFGMSVGTAVAVIAYVGKVFSPLESIGMEIENIQSAAAGVKRINEFLAEPERPEPEEAISRDPLAQSGGAELCFDRVTFSYDGKTPVLRNVSFRVASGERATLVGRTGAGKSTAFALLLGLYGPAAGRVTVCGRDAWAIPEAERRRLFGCVEQTFHPVPGTVAEQITLFDPEITREQTETAAALAGIHDHILTLERGYDTPMREGLFSQGQTQLLSIARAVAADPAVLLLDEITASLDTGTERSVLTALERAGAHRTVLSISHRLRGGTAGRLIPIGDAGERGAAENARVSPQTTD